MVLGLRTRLTKAQENQLVKNYELNSEKDGGLDLKPVVKLFGGSSFTWLFSEYNPETRMFFGLCDLGMGCPELGHVSRDELEELKFPPFKLGVEVDRFFKPTKTIKEYAVEARARGRVIA